MKKTAILLFLLTLSIALFSQQVIFTRLATKDTEQYVKVTFPDYHLNFITIHDTIYCKLQMASCYPLERAGEPELLKCAFSLIVPNGAVSASIEKADFEVINNIDIIPSKGHLYRNVNPKLISYNKGAIYQENQFIEQEQLQIGEPYQLRDYRGVSITCMPFAYNPVSRQLKVYKSLIIKIKGEYPLRSESAPKITADFNCFYQRHFLNYEQPCKSIPEQGEMLILAHDNFIEALQPLAEWKNQRGITTTIVPLSEVGSNATAIRNYLINYYKEHNLAYLILVGDAAEMPPYTIQGELCDNHYADLVGDDHYPDILLGRISAHTAGEVALQVQKFITYEKNPPSIDHFATFIGIGSAEGPGDNNEYDFAHIRNIDELLKNNTYTHGYEFFDGSHGGLDAIGDPYASQIEEALNNGAGIINYCGHGDWNRFVTSSFNNNNINQLQNINKLPFIISVACINGEYNRSSDCFAETWLKANTNGEPTGAVSALMSTINQPWNPPMCGQDEINRLLVSTNAETLFPSLGQVTFGGLVKMMDIYHDVETYHTWLLFGDPSLMMRTDIPLNIVAHHDTSLLEGTTNCIVVSPNNGATAFLSAHNQPIAQASIVNGKANLQFQSQTPMDTLTLLITQLNHIPYTGKISFYANSFDPETSSNTTEEITLSPIVASNEILISVNSKYKGSTISLYDISGKKIWQKQITQTKTSIDVKHYQSGVYFAVINSGKTIIKTIKFIKQ